MLQINKLMNNHITTRFLLYVLISILSVYLFFMFKFIDPIYYWIDNPLHVMGGFWVAMLTAWFLERYKDGVFAKDDKFITFFMILGMTALVGIGWEVLEFFYDAALGEIRDGTLIGQPSLPDTMKDLVNNLLGALLFWFWYLVRKK